MAAKKLKFPYLPNGHIDIAAWLMQIEEKHAISAAGPIQTATALAATASKGLTTFYGQPCIEQSLEMAEIILNLKLNADAVAASIMISTMQHADLSIDIIREKLGDTVAKLVHGERQMNSLHKVQAHIKINRDPTQIDRLRKTFLAMVSDIRIVLIKLAEQLCVMRSIKNINATERKRIAQETLDIYAPLANRLGVGQLKWELEDLAFHYTNPETYKMIVAFLAERRIDREQRIEQVVAQLRNELTKAQINARISGRAKHIYSIYLKMQKKHVDYKNIYDASAIRVLVPTLEDCYTALSIVHHLWEHVPEEFDDYIANPKPNGYRSIHTAVVGPDGKNLEIQIRTLAMHNEAEHGAAAHWVYKETKPTQSGADAKITFLRQLLAWHKEVAAQETQPNANFDEFLDDRVYVFTPEGDIIDLSRGATPLDFAYHIHSELGHRCRGAKINGHIVPLTHALNTGDRIEIITVPHGTPSRDWLNKELGYLQTSRARSKVTQWFRQQDVTHYIEAGKNSLERELAKTDLPPIDLQKMASRLNYKNADAMLAAVGHGSLRSAQIINIVQTQQQEAVPFKPKAYLGSTEKNVRAGTFQIEGINDLLTRIAKCCKPIPGDKIIGYITQGRGVSIHRHDCSNIKNLTCGADRFIEVHWNSDHPTAYYVDLQVRAAGETNVLKEITVILTNAKIDLVSMNSTINKKSHLLLIALTIQIYDIAQLNTLVRQITQLPNVNDVRRTN